MFNRLSGISLLLICLLLLPISASAQTTARATLTVPNTDTFPKIETYLDVFDDQGKFIHGLEAANVRVLEDEKPMAVSGLNESRPGVQLAVAINPGPSFAVRNSKGISRYDFLIAALSSWAVSRQGSTIDDLSLLTTGGSEISHVSDPAQWLSSLQASQIDARQATPDLNTLLSAVDLAADPSPRPGMGRAVLLITPPLDRQLSTSIENLSTRAIQQDVHIFVWLVTPPGAPLTQTDNQLIALCEQTGGQFANITGEESVPVLEDYLEPLRSVYNLVYNSQVTGSGTHQVSAEIQTAGEMITTTVQQFDLNLLPPDPAFISPQLEILRQPPQNQLKELPAEEIPLSEYTPTLQDVHILVDFPDGRTRPLVLTTLYVDGVAVAENNSPPFDSFAWNLQDYTSDGDHMLKVEAKDSLGLTGTSIDTLVQVKIKQPDSNALTSLSYHMPALVGLGIVLSAAILLLALVVSGRVRPSTLRLPYTIRWRRSPVTLPVPEKKEPAARHLPEWVNRLQWPHRHIAPQAAAFLTRVQESVTADTDTPIPITADELTFGNDPNQATIVLNDPSVSALHARLIHEDEKVFRITDQESIAGTWVNYTPVHPDGTALEHGDLIHIGRVSFRFTLRKPEQVRKPVITLVETPPEEPLS